ncbi:MAG: D-alanyl-D-alanine carboxypeptidase/D-alanyl-D-alanine-endopeptidase [Planctomycetes bacterium]|nr:D-alanyl-D-alanine carboxypeptidase/D-alanyl-D-alanine-endopeptidase [Planctomycetota bacterium]
MARRKRNSSKNGRLKNANRWTIAALAVVAVGLAAALLWYPHRVAAGETQPVESQKPTQPTDASFGGSVLAPKIILEPLVSRPTIASPARVKAIGRAGRNIDEILRSIETFIPKKKGAAKPNARTGFLALALDDGSVVTSHRPEQLLSGASNVKLFTTAVALVKLGPDFHFETRFASDAPIRNGVLEGDLWIQGGGDPSLTEEHGWSDGGATGALTRAAAGLANLGIREIRGSLVLDDRYFSDARYHPGWPSRDRGKPHALDVSALCAEHHKIEIAARALGGKVELELSPAMSGVRVENGVSVVAKNAARGIAASLSDDVIRVSGAIVEGGAASTSFHVLDGPKLFGYVATRAFENCSIAVGRGVRAAGLLDTAPNRTLVRLQSPAPLGEIIKITNRESDNMFAEMILKTLGARFGGAGTSAAGVEVVRRTLAEMGVATDGYAAIDGCGLAYNSKISPATTVALLRAMARTRVFEIYKDSLAGAGEGESTLRKRMRDPIFNNRVKAKTGSLDVATALSGYVEASNGETFAFSSITNYSEHGGSFKPDEDRCVRELIEINNK